MDHDKSDPTNASTLQRLKDEAKERLKDVRDEVGDELADREARLRSGLAEKVETVSEALESAADDIDDPTVTRAARFAARNVGELSDALRGQDLGDVARDLSRFARHHPAAFMLGSALLGFAAARFVMAGAPDRRTDTARRYGGRHVEYR